MEKVHSQKLIRKKAIAAVSLPRRTMGNFIPFVSGYHVLGDSEGEKSENKKGSGSACAGHLLQPSP